MIDILQYSLNEMSVVLIDWEALPSIIIIYFFLTVFGVVVSSHEERDDRKKYTFNEIFFNMEI